MSDLKLYDEAVTGEEVTTTVVPPEVIRYAATSKETVEHLAYLQEWLYRGQQFRKRPDTVEYHRFPAICRRLQYRTQILPLNIQ